MSPSPRRFSVFASWLCLPMLGLVFSACGGGGGGGGEIDVGVDPPLLAPLMAVTPNTPYQGTGIEGGFAGPANMDYLLKNIGNASMSWSVTSTESWGVVTPTGGILAPQEELIVSMVLDQSVIQTLSAGIFTGSVDFLNKNNDAGSVSRGINLDIKVAVPPVLLVEPAEDYDLTGPEGGPFKPASKVYTLTNDGTTPLNWNVQASSTGVLFGSRGGTLAPGEQEFVSVRPNSLVSTGLGIGDHSLLISFDVDDSDAAPAVRMVTVHVQPVGQSATSKTLTQFGITWTFDKAYEVGQFANGDWWVVGPVMVEGISPVSDSKQQRRTNGSMINPSSKLGTSQGYDSATYAQYISAGTYKDRLNVALDVSPSSPLSLPPGASLVSSASLSTAGLRPQTSYSAVLTVLDNPAALGSFRPGYASLDNSIDFNESQLDYGKLASLPRPNSTPDMGRVERRLLRPWIDHVPNWSGRYVHPKENMPDYGREIADQIGTASLMLHLDFTNAEKRTLLVRMVQLGIDLYSIYERDGQSTWQPFGGHMSGRKWPIIFAGLVLGDPAMSSIGLDPANDFAEDGQTFYVAETSPGVYNYGQGGYTAADVGLPEWGSYHSTRPSYDNKKWQGDPYRLCCTANVWWGEVLSAYIMGVRDLWNHEALFDYQDRYESENKARGIRDYRLSWTRFPFDMWEAYRANY